jgi:hypothetical protein
MEENVRQKACQFRLTTSSFLALCSEYHANYFRHLSSMQTDTTCLGGIARRLQMPCRHDKDTNYSVGQHRQRDNAGSPGSDGASPYLRFQLIMRPWDDPTDTDNCILCLIRAGHRYRQQRLPEGSRGNPGPPVKNSEKMV